MSSEAIRPDVSAFTDGDGSLHVTVRVGDQVYECEGLATVEFRSDLPGHDGPRHSFELRIPQLKTITVRAVPRPAEPEGVEFTRMWNCACGATGQMGNCRNCGTPRERGAVPVSERSARG